MSEIRRKSVSNSTPRAALRGALLSLLTSYFWILAYGAPEAPQTHVYLFWGRGCPHCERAIAFLQRLEAEDPRIGVRYFEVTREAGNAELLQGVVKAFEIVQPGVPLTVVGDQIWVGYSVDEQTGAEIRHRLEQCNKESDCPDVVAGLIAQLPKAVVESRPSDESSSVMTAPRAGAGAESSGGVADRGTAHRPPPRRTGPLPEQLHLPLIGEIRLRDYSLLALTLLMGAIDGFNPCAMWTLLFLIGLLIGTRDTLRMWVLGSAFIVGSAAVYFVFMAAWLNVVLFLGSILLIRVVIGLVALSGGGYYLREFVLNRGEVCKVTVPERRQHVFQRLRSLAQERNFVIAFCGIVALAFLVNLVELICSAGIPVVYTQLLAMSGVPTWQHYGYMLLYILAFMADDLFVFVTAMTTLRVTGMTTRYSRYSHLLGGVVLVAIGTLMLLRPEWLMYG